MVVHVIKMQDFCSSQEEFNLPTRNMMYCLPAEQRQNCLFSLEGSSIISFLRVQPLFDVKSHWSMMFLSHFFLFTVPVEHSKQGFLALA